jgi:hypothetical protein
MKTQIAVLIGLATASSLSLADPGAPADSGFAPLTSTIYVTTNLYNIAKHEHPSVDIAANGNVIFSWENDGGGITDFETVWTLCDSSGNLVIAPTVQTNRSLLGNVTTYESTTNTYLSFFRSDNTAIGGYTGWGGYDAKANKFGNGIGFGSMCWEIGLEIPELYDINADDDGNPPDANDALYVQLLNNDGTPLRPGVINGITNLGIMSFADADVQPTGAIRTGGWDYLANGNIVLAGDSRQVADRALTGQPSGNVPVYRVLTPAGEQVKGYAPLSSEAIGGGIQAGIGVTANGFAARWNQSGGGATIRLFDNMGNPTSTNINLATLSGHPEVGQGGDGLGCGFHGNGVDAYVNVNSSASSGTNTPWVTVINADGTLRWSRPVQDESDPIDNTGLTDVDGAIDQYGRVVVVFASRLLPNYTSYIQARLFSKAGVPLGPRFVVSEWENPANTEALYDSSNPRVAWRGSQVAVAWLGGDAPTIMATVPSYKVLASRLFTVSVSDNFNDGNDTTPLPAWARYNPIGTGSYSFPGGNKYRIQSAASPDPGTYGQGRAGSFAPGNYTNFYVAADLVDFDDTVRQVFGVAARIQNPGPGTTGGYLFSWEPGSGTLPGTSNGDLDITILINEVPVDQIENEPSGLHLEKGKSYRFAFMGTGFDFVAEVYELPNTTTPIKRLTATDPSSLYASGQVGLIVANNNEPYYDGPADATFDNFLATTGEPRLGVSQSGGTNTLSWPLIPFNLLSSPSLSSPSWTAVTTGISQVGSQFQYVIPAGPQKYYRLSYP